MPPTSAGAQHEDRNNTCGYATARRQQPMSDLYACSRSMALATRRLHGSGPSYRFSRAAHIANYWRPIT